MNSIILAAALITAAGVTNAAIYQCGGDQGRVEFSDIPCPDGVELQVETSGRMYRGSTWEPPDKPPEEPVETPVAPQPPEQPKPHVFDCGEITVKGYTAYQNLSGQPSGGSITQFQCVSGQFSIRPGLQARWNDRTFASKLASSISATLQNGEVRTSDRAFLPSSSTTSRFKQLKIYTFDLCFGASPFPVVDLTCR